MAFDAVTEGPELQEGRYEFSARRKLVSAVDTLGRGFCTQVARNVIKESLEESEVS